MIAEKLGIQARPTEIYCNEFGGSCTEKGTVLKFPKFLILFFDYLDSNCCL